ncbi:MAG: type II secretion system F family protein, partial [Pseudomonadota bacterium]
AAFATVLTLAAPLMSTDKLNSRLKAVATRREELRRKQRETFGKREGPQLRASTPSAFIKETVERLNLQELLDEAGSRKKLIMAGYRGQGPLFTFMFFRLATPFVAAIATAFYLFTVNDFDLPTNLRFAASGAAFLIGYYLPSLYLTNVIKKRQASIQQVFPDALDLLLICVESGMSIEAAFNKVAQEVGSGSIELAEEMSLTTAELSYLQDRKIAYQNLADRTGLDGVKAVSTALIQSEKYGTPLGQTLRVLAEENRLVRVQRAEKKAASLPAKLTVPMIMFNLPVLFIIILGPAGINLATVFAERQ